MSSTNLIFDLLFLLGTAYIAATISGVAGFGGALILLPVLTHAVGVKAAIPILTVAQVFGNASRVWFGRTDLEWTPIVFFLLTALPATIFGSYLFVAIESRWIHISIGMFLIFLVVYRRMRVRELVLGETSMLFGGALTGFLSGIAGSAGPLGAAFFLGLDLTATAYVASEAFTALIMHLTKTFIYNAFALVGEREIYYGVFIGMIMTLGSWTGKKLIERLSRDKFILLVELLLVVSGLHLIWNT